MLAAGHRVASANRTKFQARLKNFQRLGYPAGLGEGRGVAVKYRPEHVFLLALALQFSELGVTPVRAVRALKEYLPAIIRSLDYSLQDPVEETEAAWSPVVLYFDPNTLSDLGEAGDSKGIVFGVAPVNEVMISEWVTRDRGIRLSLISISGVLDLLGLYVPEALHDQFFDELHDWSKCEDPDLTESSKGQLYRPFSKSKRQMLTRFDFARGKPGKGR